MEITGKIIVALPEISGTSKAGNPWKKREYVLETQETYPRKVHFDFFGDKADKFPLSVGQTVKLSFDIDSREYNGRWYTSISGWQAEVLDGNQATPAAAPQQTTTYAQPQTTGTVPPPPAIEPANPNEDLPF